LLIATFGRMNFSAELINWYNGNRRDLPWRHTADAYIIWLSEVILQQTRVEQGLPYFYRFVEKYPDVIRFASADEDDILKLWQGLGYYSRGRNMLKTARMVLELHDGKFPSNYDKLIKLKGIGGYTAAAISSFSANEARAVVDGNVYRVLARYFGVDEPINSVKGQKTFQQMANDLLDQNQAGLHNQAIMEFGAMLCKPKNPDCGGCPLRPGCYAYVNKAITSLPVKLNKLKIRERFFNYFLFTDGATALMNKRGDKDIWANMYDLPMIETQTQLDIDELLKLNELKQLFGDDIKFLEASPIKKHILTHQILFVRLIKVQGQPQQIKSDWFYANVDKLKNLALPRIIHLLLEDVFDL
jgi:A/G-specific adenine glycosylase